MIDFEVELHFYKLRQQLMYGDFNHMAYGIISTKLVRHELYLHCILITVIYILPYKV